MRVHQSLLSKLATAFAVAVIVPSLLADTPVVSKTWFTENVTGYSAMPVNDEVTTGGGTWTIPSDDDSDFTAGTGISLSTGDDPLVYTPSTNSYAPYPVTMTFNVQFTSTTELPEIPLEAQLAVTAANTNNTGAAYYISLGSGTWTRLYGATPGSASVPVVVNINYETHKATVSVGSTPTLLYLDENNPTTTELMIPSGATQVNSLAFAGSGVLGDFSGLDSRAAQAAIVNGANYETLADAIAAAGNNDTVQLLADVTLTDRLFVNAGETPAYAGTNNRYATTTENKSITLDLNGKNITSASNIALAGGSLNITGTGTITTTNAGLAPVEIRGTGDLTSKRTLTIGPNVTLTGDEYGLNVFGSNDAQKNVIDVTVNGTVNGTLFVLGNLTSAENAINIVVNGTVAAPASAAGASPNQGIALNGNANVTVNNGAAVSGDSGIEVRAGNLTVNGGTITANAQTYSYTANSSGSTTKGAAIAIAQHTTQLPTSATLNGGTLSGVKTIGVTEVNNDMSGVTVLATAGYTQNSAIPEGYTWVETATSGVFTLTPAYTVLWVVEGTTVETDENVAEGSVPSYGGAEPSKTATDQYTYTFAGWTTNGVDVLNLATVEIASDTTFTAKFTETVNKYTVKFMNGETVVSSAEYDYGTLAANIAVPADLQDYSTESTVYTFDGWGTIANVTADATYNAVWTESTRKYTVKFMNGETVVSSAEYDYGTLAANIAVPANLQDYSTATTDYSFGGWGTIANVTADATYNAVWTESARKYTLTINYVGPTGFPAQEASVTQVANGTEYSVASPVVEGYTADPLTVSGTMPTQDVTVTVTYTANAATVMSIALNTNAVDNVRNGTLAATSASGKTVTVEAMLGLSGEGTAPEMTASPNGTVSGNTATFATNWNAGVEWTLTSGEKTLVGKTYAKGEAEWFTTNSVAEDATLGFGDTCSVGVKPENATVAGEAVRIEARIQVSASGASEPPAAVGEARGGFAVVNNEYVAFNGEAWVGLFGLAPTDGEVDLLMVADMAAETPTVRYYVDGVSLWTTNSTPDARVYEVPLKTLAEGNNTLQAVGFSSAEIVKSAVVAEYDVSYVAAKGDTGYTTEPAAVAAIDRTGETALEILKADFAEGITLAAGDIVKIDTTNGTYTGTVSTSAPASKVKAVTEGNVTTYTVVITPTYFIID